MTTTLSLLCPEGIVMGADSRITRVYSPTNMILSTQDDVLKIYHLEKCNLGISYWGLAELPRGFDNNISLLNFLNEFERDTVEKIDTINDVAQKIKNELEEIQPLIHTRMGLHIAGYFENEEGEYVPHLRHVFHDRCHSDGQFVNENCHIEYHHNCQRIEYPDYVPYPDLFNGDNSIANCLFNYIPSIRRERIRTDLLTLEDCIELTDFVLSSAIRRLNYFFNIRDERIPQTVGGSTNIVKITHPEGLIWIR